MAKIQKYEEWQSVIQKRRGAIKLDKDSEVAPYAAYIQHIFAMKQPNPTLYSLEHVKEDLVSHLNDFAEEVGEKMRKPPKPPKNSGKPGGKGGGGGTTDTSTGGGKGGGGGKNVKGGAGGATGGAVATGGARGGKGKQRVGETEGNEIAVEKAKPEPFNKKAEYGDMELRKYLARLPENKDVSMKASEGDEMEDDQKSFGGVRLSKKMEITPKNLEEFKAAPPCSVWLGFIRIGSRVGQNFDKLILIQLSPEKIPGSAYVFLTKDLKPKDPWHAVVMEKLWNETQHGISDWNGFSEKVMKAKKLPISELGCFFAFFLVKASDGGKNHYWNFKCRSINKWTNGLFIDRAPIVDPNDMTPQQKAAYTNMLTAVRNGFGLPKDITNYFPDAPLDRLRVMGDSKVLPLSWATAVVKVVQGVKEEGNVIRDRKEK